MLRLSANITAEYLLPARYADGKSENALSEDDIDNIHQLMERDCTFYVVKQPILGGRHDVDLIFTHKGKLLPSNYKIYGGILIFESNIYSSN